MKVSLNWLKTFVPIDLTPDELAASLTMAGLEVEAVSDRFEYLKSVRVGRVATVKNHPNADRLKVCDVDIGERMLTVVCGAPNVREGMLSPLALPGTHFPNNRILEKGVIRGVTSEGMLCSEAELELGTDTSGIMTLDDKLTKGQALSAALNLSDTMIEIDLTPNRPDCLSIIGTAREIAAIVKKGLSCPDTTLPVTGKEIHERTSVTVDAPDLCPRYAARIIEDITVAPSPFWLQERLRSVGLRPINNIVDITNFVLMEYGQPLHAFDLDRLEENRIVVRAAAEGEVFTTLDEKERTLLKDMLLICDGKKPVAIAGVMGGLNSEIETDTRNVLLESAYFNPVSIRKTSKNLGLNTDASHRFERGIDPQGTLVALDRAARLIAEIGGGRILDGVIDKCGNLPQPQTIALSMKQTNRLLGTDFSRTEIRDFLVSIGFDIREDTADALSVTAPSFRVDIKRPEDLMEEVARLSGYDHIPTTYPLIPAETRTPQTVIVHRRNIKTIMNGFGFDEAINYSFMDKRDCDRLLLAPDDYRRSLVEILNPLTEDQTVMRSSLLPGLLKSAHRNISQRSKTGRLFEIGKIFIGKGKTHLPDEIEILAGLWTGSRTEALWNVPETACDFYDLKGIVEGLFNALKIKNISFTRMPMDAGSYIKNGFAAQIVTGDTPLGLVGELHPRVLKNYDLKQTVFYFELDMTRLYGMIPESLQAGPIPKYPATSRDVTVIIDRDIEAGSLLTFIRDLKEGLVEQLSLFDVFADDPIPEGKKSVSFRIVYRSHEETLEDDMVNNIHKRLSERLIDHFNAALPE
ncbi:phenylalanine--tRNA ligase subunit beta [Thermodesulfobacteriota bacterium]